MQDQFPYGSKPGNIVLDNAAHTAPTRNTKYIDQAYQHKTEDLSDLKDLDNAMGIFLICPTCREHEKSGNGRKYRHGQPKRSNTRQTASVTADLLPEWPLIVSQPSF